MTLLRSLKEMYEESVCEEKTNTPRRWETMNDKGGVVIRAECKSSCRVIAQAKNEARE